MTLQQAIRYKAQALELSVFTETDPAYKYFLLKNAHALEVLGGDCWDVNTNQEQKFSARNEGVLNIRGGVGLS
jgi:hypothetical protein